ncbi:hypothetical protein, partial [uncultured Legionella sp.]|uniref:hypothetical protein n=1 Tax=uncultured Legionella sp. TaxID=210934 RepID=UPI0026019186
MTKSPPTNILVIVPDIIPSVVIGLLKPLIALEQQRKVNLRLHIQARLSLPTAGLIKRDSTWCDVAVFGRNTEMADLRLLYQLKRLKKRIIYEIDDNFEQISLNTPIGIYHRNYFRLHVVRRFFQLADMGYLGRAERMQL